MFDRRDISKELTNFCKSNQFKNFEIISQDLAAAKFLEIQGSQSDASHADMIANRKILNFYLNLPNEIKFRYQQLLKEKEIAAERTSDI